eukprot:8414293-Alexandrium_andersonii.AAC.1
MCIRDRVFCESGSLRMWYCRSGATEVVFAEVVLCRVECVPNARARVRECMHPCAACARASNGACRQTGNRATGQLGSRATGQPAAGQPGSRATGQTSNRATGQP